MNVLVVGGAGYIGAHTVRALLAAGHRAVIYDNLSEGHRQAAEQLNVPLIVGDLDEREKLTQAFKQHQFDAVIHFAAYAYVGESVTDPAKYYRNNTCAAIQLADVMREQQVNQLIFSSTCATYGNPTTDLLGEDHPQNPINPYGRSKLFFEHVLKDYSSAYGFRFVALRYFNASGASDDGLIGEQHRIETHLIPLACLAALGKRDKLTVFGTDYPTPDGTCIRDYIHVDDLASAHVLALEYLGKGGESTCLNVGTGHGHSVKQVIDCVEQVSGKRVPIEFGPRRAGDPPKLVAASGRIGSLLGWSAKKADLKTIVASAYRWFEAGGRYV